MDRLPQFRSVKSPVVRGVLVGALTGAALAATLAALWPLLFFFPTSTGIEIRTYFLWQAVPGLLSIAGGALIGWWLYRCLQQPSDVQESPDSDSSSEQ